jgi:hypothetical protein
MDISTGIVYIIFLMHIISELLYLQCVGLTVHC